jgi:hypothetical protein
LSCVTLASAGCSLLLSTSDLSEQAVPDSGTPPPGAEAGADGADTADARTDAVVVPRDGSARCCETLSPPPKFCADFDGNGAVDEGWDDVTIAPENVGALSRDALARDRSSLLVKLTAPQSCSYVRPAKTFPSSGFGLRVSFSFRPSSPWTTDAIFALLGAAGQGADCAMLFHFDEGKASLHLQYGSPPVDETFVWDGAPPLDVWSTIETTIDPAGDLTIALGGKKVLTLPLPDGCKAGPEVYFAPGFHCEQTAHEARYDDVVVDYP